MKPRQQAFNQSTVPIPSSSSLKDKREHLHTDALFLSFQEKGIFILGSLIRPCCFPQNASLSAGRP
ncbi:hypothetical protein AB685_15375 [Bacillus sp. LL01]|nr:hypothetical protein AB685_15375 [Bacillus sp. LL01]